MTSPLGKFIDGTASTASYMVVARKGKVVLGFRPLGIQDGMYTSVPGTTYVFGRIRSASAGNLFDEEDSEANVAQFPAEQDFAEAWPTITFQKKNSTRASCIFGAYIEGSIQTDPKKVLDYFEDSNMIEKMADAIIGMVGEENVVVRKGVLISWMHEQLDPQIAKYKQSLEMAAQYQQHVKENMGVFEVQTGVLKGMMEEQPSIDLEKLGIEAAETVEGDATIMNDVYEGEDDGPDEEDYPDED